MADEKRNYDRLQVSLWAVEKSPDAAYYHYVTELSAGGVFLEKRLPLPVGSEVELEFTLPSGLTIRATGSVVRQADDGKGNGIKFEKISDEHQAAIEEFLKSSDKADD